MPNQLITYRLSIDYSLISSMSLISWISYLWSLLMPARSSMYFGCFSLIRSAIFSTWQTVLSNGVQMLVSLSCTITSGLLAPFSGGFSRIKGTFQCTFAFSFSSTARGRLCWYHGFPWSLSRKLYFSSKQWYIGLSILSCLAL